MKKYKLISKYGNRVIYTNSEREKNNLLEKGFHIEKQLTPKNTQATKTKTQYSKTKRSEAKKNEGKVEE